MTTTQLLIGEESTSAFVETDDFRLHYHDVGTGHPILLLHGAGPGATAWSNFGRNIPELAESNRVLALDLPGWGRSSTPTADTRRNLVEAAIGLLDALQIEKAAFVGNSMGGMMSIAAAVRYPDRVSHLVAMGTPCPGPNYFQPAGLTEGLRILFEGYRETTPENLKRLVQVMCFDQSLATDELSALRARRLCRIRTTWRPTSPRLMTDCPRSWATTCPSERRSPRCGHRPSSCTDATTAWSASSTGYG
jgi:2-hydroxy-6-oxonona-2,4-dienedioate hydrolase